MKFNVMRGDQSSERKPKLEAVYLVTIPKLEKDWLERFSILILLILLIYNDLLFTCIALYLVPDTCLLTQVSFAFRIRENFENSR